MRRLLIRPGAIGDVILSLPMMEQARAEYTEVWAPRPVLPLIRFADHTRAIIDTGLDRVGVIEGAQCEALESFDSIYSWYGTEHAEFRAAVSHLPFKFFPARELPETPPHIPVPSIAFGSAQREDFAIIHPFSSSTKKNWPLENFRELAGRLPIPVKWTAGPEEKFDSAVRFDDLHELACWIATARVYIGNDSGISHLAAAVGTPVVAIFLATDPLIWRPRGEHVIVLENPSLYEIVAAVRQFL